MITRRDVLKTAALSALSYSRVMGANDKIGLGLIGAGSRGQSVMGTFQRNSEVEVRAVCDIYGARTEDALRKAPGARSFVPHEKLLELKEIDAVLIGSPDHWHKDHAVDAMNAGKDVYVEKPLCRTLEEAPVMVQAARRNNRICQVGVQQRSGPVYIEARDQFVMSGRLGRIRWVECIWNDGPPRPYTPRAIEKPPNLDWLRFLGPVRYRDWNPRIYFNFRAFLDFNGGRMTDFGHHWLDVVHMYLGERAPDSAVAAGAIYDSQDGKDAPDTISALFEYPGFVVSFQSVIVGNPMPYGVTFYGDRGKLHVNRNRYAFTPAEKGVEPIHKDFPGDITADHVRNFLDCCKSRKLPNGDVALAAVSIQPPLLAVRSYLEKRCIRFDAEHSLILPGSL
jgi:predicted dehydrogenase